MKISKRHKRPALTTKVTRRIAEIPRKDWDSVFPQLPTILENYDFFKTLDESGIEQFSFYYIMVYDREKAVGATFCFLLNYSLDTSISGPLRRLTNSVRKIAPNIFSMKAIVCGMPMGQGRMGAAGSEDAVLKTIIHRMERLAKKNKAPVI
ncbi:MAG: hypothetical protein HZA72_01460 [Candidatus Omnitrophica bacterium]|nr:hypothetical protein [Candidatus Omnitrophota bacterium]